VIAATPLGPSTGQHRAGRFAAVVSATALASLTTIAVSWPEPPPSAGAVPLDLGDPVSVALAFTQRHQALDPDACQLATPQWRAKLGRRMRCLPSDPRSHPEVRVLSESRFAESAVALIEIRPHDQTVHQVTVGLALVDDRWLVDSTTPTPVEAR
jgi:hypothetical protein